MKIKIRLILDFFRFTNINNGISFCSYSTGSSLNGIYYKVYNKKEFYIGIKTPDNVNNLSYGAFKDLKNFKIYYKINEK